MSDWTIYVMGVAHGAVACSGCAILGRFLARRTALVQLAKGEGGGDAS